jgi:xanthine/CO dehydrogenase XdhC/CoxF family maturation factor
VSPLEFARDWREAGHGVALATVVETWGSSPCAAGSQLTVAEDGRFEGSVSGGCVEGAVIERALTVIDTRAAEVIEFQVSDENAWDVGLACGGRVRIYVEPVE